MLNLNNPIVYSVDEQTKVNKVLASDKTGSEMWASSTVYAVKGRISEHMLTEQNCKCTYCEKVLTKGDVTIDHVAPKGLHPKFTFEPLNLVVACRACNSTSVKGEDETIDGIENPVYTDNKFLIVHPFLDNPDEHFVYQDEKKTIYDLVKCSKEALYTITAFGWDTLTAQEDREMVARNRDVPINVARRIADITIYKKKVK